jgi:hypothetical protein
MKNKVFYILSALCLMTIIANAQILPPPVAPPTATPIDGGASLIIALCAGYGLNRMRKNSRSQH